VGDCADWAPGQAWAAGGTVYSSTVWARRCRQAQPLGGCLLRGRLGPQAAQCTLVRCGRGDAGRRSRLAAACSCAGVAATRVRSDRAAPAGAQLARGPRHPVRPRGESTLSSAFPLRHRRPRSARPLVRRSRGRASWAVGRRSSRECWMTIRARTGSCRGGSSTAWSSGKACRSRKRWPCLCRPAQP
jgi:hypothetical protein